MEHSFLYWNIVLKGEGGLGVNRSVKKGTDIVYGTFLPLLEHRIEGGGEGVQQVSDRGAAIVYGTFLHLLEHCLGGGGGGLTEK